MSAFSLKLYWERHESNNVHCYGYIRGESHDEYSCSHFLGTYFRSGRYTAGSIYGTDGSGSGNKRKHIYYICRWRSDYRLADAGNRLLLFRLVVDAASTRCHRADQTVFLQGREVIGPQQVDALQPHLRAGFAELVER